MSICHCEERSDKAISLSWVETQRRARVDAGIAWGRIGVSGRKLFGMATAMMMKRPQRVTSVPPIRSAAKRQFR